MPISKPAPFERISLQSETLPGMKYCVSSMKQERERPNMKIRIFEIFLKESLSNTGRGRSITIFASIITELSANRTWLNKLTEYFITPWLSWFSAVPELNLGQKTRMKSDSR